MFLEARKFLTGKRQKVVRFVSHLDDLFELFYLHFRMRFFLITLELVVLVRSSGRGGLGGPESASGGRGRGDVDDIVAAVALETEPKEGRGTAQDGPNEEEPIKGEMRQRE